MRRITTSIEEFRLKEPFSIATGTIERLVVLVVQIQEGQQVGRGECVPSAANMVVAAEGRRFAQDAEQQVLSVKKPLESGADRQALQNLLPKGPARNAVDCALWDLEARTKGCSVPELAGIDLPDTLITASTIGLADPDKMAAAAKAMADRNLLKVKLGGGQDVEAISAVRSAAPKATIIVDINGGWQPHEVEGMAHELVRFDVKLIEQPLRSDDDDVLASIDVPIPLCADESCHDRDDLDDVVERYDFINIKLDKTGGLTEALCLADDAMDRGLQRMVGCMAGTSLSMAPAAVVGSLCQYVDLDGPLLLQRDRTPGLKYDGDTLYTRQPALWGG